MGLITLIVNVIIAIPKIWSLAKEIKTAVDKANSTKKKKVYQEKKKALEDAKTKKEVESAANDFLSNS